jgi:hypothetical protein
MNTCTAVHQMGKNLDAYFDECLHALDQVA